jgi:hypothetical protein
MRKWLKPILGVVVFAAAVVFCGQKADAGRMGGPAWESGSVPPHRSVFYTMPFVAGEPANLTVIGDGNSPLEVFVYDADGHVTRGGGFGDQKGATVNVYRSGMFRVEVRNLGPRTEEFTLYSN